MIKKLDNKEDIISKINELIELVNSKEELICEKQEEQVIEDDRYWEPKDGEDYYAIERSLCDKFLVGYANYDDNEYDNGNIEIGNCFKTRELAEKELEKRKAIVRVKKFIAENRLFPRMSREPNWLGKKSYMIYYNDSERKFNHISYENNRFYVPTDIGYFPLPEEAQKVINSCEKDLRIIFEIE